MHQEISLHGHIDDTIEFMATAAAKDAFQRCFYESDGSTLRFFSPGNELVLTAEGVTHRGNGGSCCEYMFGVEQPLADLAKSDVTNRLVMYGTSFQETGALQFSDRTEGFHRYERIFFEGHAVCNYFFFVTGSFPGSLREQQEGILRQLGKVLKRSPAAGLGNDLAFSDEIFSLLGHKTSLYLIRLIHKKHRQYLDSFSRLYEEYKSIPDQEFEKLQQLADELDIDRYQQERIRIDVMYRHPDNRRIVDEYKNILIDCHVKGSIDRQENARLTRLKTLSVRNKIPAALFYTLDDMLKPDKLIEQSENGYLAEARQILDGIFLHEYQVETELNAEDIIKLLEGKRLATENRDHAFEQLLLETGKICDEKIRDGGDIRLLENFSQIITYFDRYDNVTAHLSELAFMENIVLGEEAIRSLLGNRKEFDQLSDKLFNLLFLKGIMQNPYLGRFGGKKIQFLSQGLLDIEKGSQTVQAVAQGIKSISEEERLYRILIKHIKEHIRSYYSRYNTKAEQDELRTEISVTLMEKGVITSELPANLFRDAILNIKKEAMYLHSLLPRIIAENNAALREDFLNNSGLDRFYLEELEREYFENNDLSLEELYNIRKGLSDDE
ncbi:MAG: TIGR04442 family protein [Desulfuromonas sp.]|nr:MAG: TIGR04442 family protein [Desulfuromonas sp.]